MLTADNTEENRMFELTFERPSNFFSLPHEQQWEIDSQLGILDWDGRGMTEEQQRRFRAHYK